jgi:hypothetical protein
MIHPFEKLSVVNIEPTNFCNLHCAHCGDDKTRKTGFIDTALFQKIAKQCTGKEIRLFMSGEPLFHPDIENLIVLARSYSNKVVIHTNATKLDEKMSRKLINSGLTHLSISFDGIDKEEYENIRVGANFEQVSDNIKNFIKMNNGKIHLTLQRIIKQGENPIALYNLFPGAHFYPVITRHSWDVKDKIEGHKPESIYEKNCYFLWNYLSILWDGRTVACCADLNGKCIIGDANKQTLPEIWNSDIMNSIRSRMIQRLPIQEICSACERYKP